MAKDVETSMEEGGASSGAKSSQRSEIFNGTQEKTATGFNRDGECRIKRSLLSVFALRENILTRPFSRSQKYVNDGRVRAKNESCSISSSWEERGDANASQRKGDEEKNWVKKVKKRVVRERRRGTNDREGEGKKNDAYCLPQPVIRLNGAFHGCALFEINTGRRCDEILPSDN